MGGGASLSATIVCPAIGAGAIAGAAPGLDLSMKLQQWR